MSRKQTKYQKGARGQNCTLRFDSCQNNTETVVLCHLPGWLNKIVGTGVLGLSLKSNDEDGVDACSYCHDILDHRLHGSFTNLQIADRYLSGIKETRENRKERGIS